MAGTVSNDADVSKCSVCSKMHTDPRILPCAHTFCLQCIKDHAGKAREIDENAPKFACPQCHNACRIAASELDKLAKNAFRARMNSLAGKRKGKIACDRCSGHADNKRRGVERTGATKHCSECELNVCEDCADSHRRERATRRHKLVDVELDDRQPEDLAESLSHCEKHGDHKLIAYCFNCRRSICATCLAKYHKIHACSALADVADMLRSQMTADVDAVTWDAAQYRDMLTKLNAEKDALDSKVQRAKTLIGDRAEQLKKIVDREQQVLEQRLEALKVDGEKHIDAVANEVECLNKSIDDFKTYLDELVRQGTDNEIADQAGLLHNAAGNLQMFDEIVRSVDSLQTMDVTFKASALPTSFNGDLIGTVDLLPPGAVYATNVQITNVKIIPITSQSTIKPYHATPTVTKVACRGNSVRGVTSVGCQLFVVRCPSEQQIEVFDTMTFSIQRTLRVSGLSDHTFGLASCATNNCLYASDTYSVHRVELTGDTMRWRLGVEPSGLSVNRACNVLVPYWSSRKIQEFTSRGSLVREIVVQSEAANLLWHAVQLDDGSIAVSHHRPVHDVSIVRPSGKVDVSYRRTPESTAGQLVEPRHLAVDRNGWIFIVDGGNDRIVVWKPTASYAYDLPLEIDGGLRGPWALHLDESRNRLYVGEWNAGRVLVLDDVVTAKTLGR